MPERPKDEERERRIEMEIVVDAYSPDEQGVKADGRVVRVPG